jgi:membrane-associated protease RseP (regulator of RpoE activity)
LNQFEFDYDLTFMVFFLNAEDRVYARYGGRDAKSTDSRQSLAGLHYTMESVLQMHGRAQKVYAPRPHPSSFILREVTGMRRGGRGCVHCHQAKEGLISSLRNSGKWSPELVWRYPLPENLGFRLEVDRGNVIEEVTEKSPASGAGLKVGDVVRRLNGVPVHSFADAQFALDLAPRTGAIEVVWQRGDKTLNNRLPLPEGWRKTELAWRASLRHLTASARLYGTDLTPEEKKRLGLAPGQLAFRQKDTVTKQAKAAGVRPGDIILGIDNKLLQMDVDGFLRFVQDNYVIGDRVALNIIRDGRRMNLSMTFLPWL